MEEDRSEPGIWGTVNMQERSGDHINMRVYDLSADNTALNVFSRSSTRFFRHVFLGTGS